MKNGHYQNIVNCFCEIINLKIQIEKILSSARLFFSFLSGILFLPSFKKIEHENNNHISVLVFDFIQQHQLAQFPDVEIQRYRSKLVSLDDLQGEKFTVIDFWATWCKPCVTAIPKINTIYNEYSPKGIAFIGVNVDGPRNLSKVKPFATSMKIEYPLVLDPDQNLVNRFNVNVFPNTYCFKRQRQRSFYTRRF